ncbi:c-type cytochrome [bacterium]|jgi:cytochrome c553|nr:c-type cytochrome [bacterium]
MRELGMTLLGCLAISMFFVAKVYPSLEYTGYSSNSSCTGQCYADYVALNGTAVEIEQRKQALANLDEFSDIRSLWAGCAACHGAEGQGMAVFPKLAGQSSDYIVGRLNTYKNRGQVGAMSSTMWSQAGMLSADQMEQIGKFIEAGLPGK